MEVEIGRGKKGRRAYGFDDIAIVPSRRTRDPDDVDISWTLGPYRFELPLLASAMDGVVSPATAKIIGKLGGLAVLNLEGIWTRYEDADAQLERIARLPKEVATREMQAIYQEPIKPELIRRRSRPCTACASRAGRSSRAPPSAPATPSWPASSRPATPGPRPRSACASGSRAERSRRSVSARASSSRARSSG